MFTTVDFVAEGAQGGPLKRIVPAETVAIFEAANVVPSCGAFGVWSGGRFVECCLLTALALHRNAADLVNRTRARYMGCDEAANSALIATRLAVAMAHLAGLDGNYGWGLMVGFDGAVPCLDYPWPEACHDEVEWKSAIGIMDGRACRAEMGWPLETRETAR